ncbi:MAG: glycine betaine ABC transporter substrate-binding protein, partial [Thermodesulfobacteriota bacterium]
MNSLKVWKKSLARTLLLIFCLILPVVSAQAAGETVKLAYVEWSSEIASANVVKAVLQEKMGIRCEIMAMKADEMWEAVAESEVEGMVAAWLPLTHSAYLEKYRADVVDL